MKDYRAWEIGMLWGTAMGGALGIGLFTATDHAAWFTLTFIGMAAGRALGSYFEKKNGRPNNP